jgi:hypothetical protein
MKPPAADGDLLGPGFECIGEQYSTANAGRAAAKLPARQSAAHMVCDAARAMSDLMQNLRRIVQRATPSPRTGKCTLLESPAELCASRSPLFFPVVADLIKSAAGPSSRERLAMAPRSLRRALLRSAMTLGVISAHAIRTRRSASSRSSCRPVIRPHKPADEFVHPFFKRINDAGAAWYIFDYTTFLSQHLLACIV